MLLRNLFVASLALILCHFANAVEQWDCVDFTLHGSAEGNSFNDVALTARFTSGDKSIDVTGFYDGDGVYRIRFMPPTPGHWRYQTQSNQFALNGQTGEFTCDAPAPQNHGPVRVRNTFHFAYADGTSFKPIGTTSYGWVFQPDDLEDQTLKTLASSPFNKLRMCIIPIRYHASKDEPIGYPFVKRSDGKWDFTRFDEKYFQHLDRRIQQLRDMNVQADVILFSPYNVDLGFHEMSREDDDRFVRYTVARLSAYRNVWWSLANEYDLIKDRVPADWERIGKLIQHDDPYDHLRSVHFSKAMFDLSAPWITHMSVQNGNAVADFGRASLYRDTVPKPVVYDEVCYEGNLIKRWGQLSGEEMTYRFWLGTIAGTYVGHGEVWEDVPESRAWTARGAELRGASPARIAFLKTILDDAPPEGLEPIDRYYESNICGKPGEYYLIYFGKSQPADWTFQLYKEGLADGMKFSLDVLDTWNMTITPTGNTFVVKQRTPYMFGEQNDAKIDLPAKPYIALRLKRIH